MATEAVILRDCLRALRQKGVRSRQRFDMWHFQLPDEEAMYLMTDWRFKLLCADLHGKWLAKQLPGQEPCASTAGA